jgi:hypothetical protein
MGFQFAHVESYSRSGSRGGGHTVAEIIAEARRSPDACLHVATPKSPVLVYGCGLTELERRHDDLVISAKETLASGKQRAVRKDTASLFTCILSHPATPEECRADSATKAAVQAWAKDSVKWLRRDLEVRGGILETVVMHVDESHIHLHAYGLHSSGHADRLHPGKIAKKTAVDAALASGQDKKTANAVGDKAYVTAMRTWQDSYSQKVGLPHGLTRLGPARRRLTRSEWMTEKAAAKSVLEARTLAKGVKDEVKAAEGSRNRILEEAQQKARLLAMDGERRMQAAKAAETAAADAALKARVAVREAHRERDRILFRARSDLGRLRSIGVAIRTLWDSLRVSVLRRNIRQEVQGLIDREAAKATEALRRLHEEYRRRRAAETRLADVIQSARSLGWERDEIRRERDRLLGPATISNPWNGPKFP